MPAFATVPQLAVRLRRSTWLAQIQQAWLILIGGAILLLLLPVSIKQALRPLFLVAPLFPLIAKDLAHLPDAAARLRSAIAARAWLALPKALLHPEQLGLLRLDRALRQGFMGWLLRRPQPQPSAGQPLGYLERGSYRTACAIVWISTLIELPLDAGLVPLFVADESKRTTIHLLMLAGAVSTLVYMIGDRWLIGAGRHALTESELRLQVGARTRGSIPLDAIAAWERLDEPMEKWLRRKGIAACEAVRASPLDKPNAVLILKADSPVRLTHHGVERTGLACVFLYLDRPRELLHALETRHKTT